jgi:hypothetical protein
LRNLSRRSFRATTRKFPAEEISSNNCVSKTTRLSPWGSPCAYSVYFRTKSSGLSEVNQIWLVDRGSGELLVS